jgi:hypothetical protein
VDDMDRNEPMNTPSEIGPPPSLASVPHTNISSITCRCNSQPRQHLRACAVATLCCSPETPTETLK